MRTNGAWALAAAMMFAACAESADDSDMSADTTARDTAGIAGTGSGEQDFLTQMSDHHEGLVLIAERARDVATDDSVESAAERLHEVQAAERDTLVGMLAQHHGAEHSPEAMAKNVAQADSLGAMSGSEADRYFLRTTIAHHREGIAMIDQHMAHLETPQVRTMAERMKAAQQRDISELEAKLSGL